jgi:hypothetical protein
MDNVVDDLAGLGLNLDNAAPVDQVETPVEAKEDAVVKTRAPRTAVKLAEIKIEGGFSLAPITRAAGFGGGRESKYKFDEQTEPVNVGSAKEPKWEYSTQLIVGEEGEDPKKVASSARAAVAAQNKKHKDAGEKVRFVSRAEGNNIRIYRVDDTIAED